MRVMRRLASVVTAVALLAGGGALATAATGGGKASPAASQYQSGKGCAATGSGAVQYQYGKSGCGPWKTGGVAGKSGGHTGPPGKRRN